MITNWIHEIKKNERENGSTSTLGNSARTPKSKSTAAKRLLESTVPKKCHFLTVEAASAGVSETASDF